MRKKIYFFVFIVLGLILSCQKKTNTTSIDDSPDYKKGEAFFDSNVDSAFFYFNKVTLNSSDTLEIAMAYSCLSILQSDAGDFYGSQENLLASLKLVDENNEDHRGTLLSDFNELGNTNLKLGNYESALHYYNQALKYTNDNDFKNTVLNNKALVYQKLGNYNNAISIYQSLISTEKKDTKTYARILCNYAITQWKKDPNYNAAPELHYSLSIREKLQDKWGINSSLSHLAEFFSHSHPDSALYFADKMYAIAQELKSPDNELEALQKLISLHSTTQDKQYFNRYFSLNDSLQSSRNNAKNQFALIKYEAAKMKADKLLLEKENTEKNTQIILLWFLLTGIIGITSIGFILYRKRKQKLLHDQQLKTSRKVHDTVANNIYRIISEVEHSDTIQKENLLYQLDTVYERSRNISHEIADPSSIQFDQTINELLTSFSSPNTSVSIVGNSVQIWMNTTSIVQNELQYILQELMVNMKKHSSASNVSVKFERLENELHITYTDDGVGISKKNNYGKGLKNTGNRIKNIGGKIIFDNSNETGLKILLFVPIDITR